MKKIEEFKKLICKSLYYEAHEVLEELWFPIRKTKDDYCLVLKGFINASVSLELYKRNKIKQSQKIFLIYKKYVTNKRMINTTFYEDFKALQLFMDNEFMKKNLK